MNLNGRLPLVLHVEDDDGDAHLVVRALAQSRCPVRIQRASDGAEAMDILGLVTRGEQDKPDLVLTDLRLPFASGVDVIRWGRQLDATCDVPMVVLSSSTHENDRQECEEAGSNEYLVKPMNISDLQLIVQDICDRYLWPCGDVIGLVTA